MIKALFTCICLALLVLPPPLQACSCASYPAPFCSRDLDAIDQARTVVFVGRATKAAGGIRDLQLQMQQAAAGGAFPPAPAAGLPQLPEGAAAILEAAKRMYLEQYGSRLDPEQLAQLRNATSLQDLEELSAAIHMLGRPVDFEILENLVGALPQQAEIFTGRGGGDCGFDFQEGETYLIEAHRRQNGEWHSWMCESRVSSIEAASEDLRTLRAWKAGEPLRPRIYGSVQDWTQRRDSHPRRYPVGSGVRLVLSRGEAITRTAAGPDGRFHFENLESATYKLQLEEPGWRMIKVSDGRGEIDLTTRGCAELSVLIAEEQGAIRGRILAQPGEDLPDHLWIEAIPRDLAGAAPFDATARRSDGLFEIDEIEPGDYYVAINVNNVPSGPHHPSANHGRIWPYGPTYYPGVADRESAAVFHVERGQTISLKDWRLPHRLQERRLTGKAILPDGTPGSKVRLILSRPGIPGVAGRSGPTGEDGMFEVWPLESLSYMLEAASYDRETRVVYRGQTEISDEEDGPLILQLEATDERPTDRRFFNPYNRKDN